jgi:hypothetical protein
MRLGKSGPALQFHWIVTDFEQAVAAVMFVG